MANHTDTAYSMELSEVDDNAFEIMHCNNPTTDYPEMKARVIHWSYKLYQTECLEMLIQDERARSTFEKCE